MLCCDLMFSECLGGHQLFWGRAVSTDLDNLTGVFVIAESEEVITERKPFNREKKETTVLEVCLFRIRTSSLFQFSFGQVFCPAWQDRKLFSELPQ